MGEKPSETTATSPNGFSQPVLRFILITVFVYFLLNFAYTTILVPTHLDGSPELRGDNPMDVALYYTASSVVKQGHADQIYNRSFLVEQAQGLVGEGQWVGWYIYPPIFSIVFLPLTYISFGIAKLIWLFLNQGMMAAGLVFLLLCTKNLKRNAKLAVFTLALMTTSLIVNLQMGNVNVVIFFLLALTLFLLVKGRDVFAGIPLGVAVSIKLMPILIIFYLLIKKKFLAAGTAVATTALLTVMGVVICGWEVSKAFVSDILPKIGWLEISQDAPSKFTTINQSLHGFFLRLFSDSPDDFTTPLLNSPGTVLVLTLLSTVLLLSASVWVILGKDCKDESRRLALGFGLFVLIMHLVSSISWVDHLVSVLIPLVLLLDWIEEKGNEKLPLFYAAAVGYALVAVNNPYDYPKLMHGWRLFLLSPVLCGMLIMWMATFVFIRRLSLSPVEPLGTQPSYVDSP